jgi:hypothetical protein
MIPNEGLVAALQAIVEKPMLLCLFSEAPENAELATYADFKEPSAYEPFPVERRMWRIDQAAVEAALDRHVFRFKAPTPQVAGWLLMLRTDRTVLSFNRFARPYPINSSEDTIAVRARIVLKPRK